MANMKQLMGLSAQDLIAMGAQVGLTFHTGMKKSHMVQQLSASAASGWMDVNAGLMTGIPEDDFGFSGDASMISDAAHVAQMISSAGFTETFHEAMNGPAHHVEAVQAYMQNLGVSSDDVWMHMPKANPNIPANHFGALNAYMRDTLSGHQDIMPSIPGHYLGDILGEYATNQGGIKASYEHLAHMYLDKSQYDSASLYNEDAARVAHRLAGAMGPAFHEIAAVTGMASEGSKHASTVHVSYMNALPQLGDSAIVGGVYAPRMALNASGLPLGAFGHGIRDEYSLSASLSGVAGWNDASKAIYNDVSETVKSLAKVYGGETGMNARRHVLSERDMIMDSAARYADVSDVRSGYANLVRDLGDDPRYNATNIRAIIDNNYDQMDAQAFAAPSGISNPAMRLPTVAETGTAFSANIGAPTDYNSARARRESIAIANFDSIPWRDIENESGGSPITYHNSMEQGSQEWLDFRKNYDITGSTVGSYLGNNAYTRPWAEMIDKVGLSRSKGISKFQQAMFDRGHRTEEEARARVADQYGISIGQTGAITNANYPSFMYSPDGLIGDDALWEHKNPERAGKFADLLAGDHPDYMDQVQLGMLVSGRSRTLFSQTIGNQTQSQWIDRDEGWYDRNRGRLDSTLGRLAAGREFVRSNPDLEREDLIAGARKAMMGEGIWRDVSQKSNRGFSATAGTESDTFARSSYSEFSGDNGYRPNFTHYTPQYPTTTTTSGGEVGSPLAQAVKEGILGAQEENRQKRIGVDPTAAGTQADADFDDLGNPRGWSRSRIDDAFGGGGGRGGTGGRNGSYYDDFGMAGGAIAAGIAGGSLSSAGGGVMSALSMTPWGRIAAVGIGSVQIGNELAENANESLGVAQDAGVGNPVAYASMSQGMEMMGLSEQQAGRLNATTHSAYNTLLNGDPSAAIRIVQGTRGLVNIGDIRAAQGDPVALARVIRERGQERGWSEARIAGAMQMAGLDGMARAVSRNESHQVHAEEVRNRGVAADTGYAVSTTEALQSNRVRSSLTYGAQSLYFQHGGDAAKAGATAVGLVASAATNVYDFIKGEESGGREYDSHGQLLQGVSPDGSYSGAKGSMQVTDSTMRDPGKVLEKLGLKPLDPRTATPEQRAQFGRDYYDTLVKYYHGDSRKAQAAYTDGFGNVDRAVASYNDNWLSAMPDQAQKRVGRYDTWQAKSSLLNQGAGAYAPDGSGAPYNGGAGPTVINVNINARINNQQAQATVSTPGGQTVTQQINVGNGAMQKR